MVGDTPLIEVMAARRNDQLLMEVGDWTLVHVPQRLFDRIARGKDAAPINTAFIDRVPTELAHHPIWSAQQVIPLNVAFPYVVTIGTSAASRPRAIITRPRRRSLLRGSNVHQRPSR